MSEEHLDGNGWVRHNEMDWGCPSRCPGATANRSRSTSSSYPSATAVMEWVEASTWRCGVDLVLAQSGDAAEVRGEVAWYQEASHCII
jgi:hypothetical protein